MLRNLLGFALFAIIALFLLKVLFGLFGLVLGLLGTVLWFAFIGFVIYLLLKLFAPDTARTVIPPRLPHPDSLEAVDGD